MRHLVLFAAVAIAFACASAPQAPAPEKGSIWGYLQLVPRVGNKPHPLGSASYGDGRLRDVVFVDYSRPGFAVVYVEESEEESERTPGGQIRLTIRDTRVHSRIEPTHAAVMASGSVRVVNSSRESRVLSCPGTGLVRQLAPGESTVIELGEAGAYSLFLLDVPGAQSTVFAAPGPFAVVSESGRFELRNLEPGRRRLGTWHPRAAPTSRWVDLVTGEVLRLDLEIGVGQKGGGDDGSH